MAGSSPVSQRGRKGFMGLRRLFRHNYIWTLRFTDEFTRFKAVWHRNKLKRHSSERRLFGYCLDSKAYRVYTGDICRVAESCNVTFIGALNARVPPVSSDPNVPGIIPNTFSRRGKRSTTPPPTATRATGISFPTVTEYVRFTAVVEWPYLNKRCHRGAKHTRVK